MRNKKVFQIAWVSLLVGDYAFPRLAVDPLHSGCALCALAHYDPPPTHPPTKS